MAGMKIRDEELGYMVTCFVRHAELLTGLFLCGTDGGAGQERGRCHRFRGVPFSDEKQVQGLRFRGGALTLEPTTVP